MITLSEFYTLLDHHDWFYAYSDDGRYYRAGLEQMLAIKSVLEQAEGVDKRYEDLYDDFRAYIESPKTVEKPKNDY